MDWRRYLDLQPVPDPTMTNPVGTSTMQRVTNPSPDVSPLAAAILNTGTQQIGRVWNAGTGRAKPYTGQDMAGLTASGNEAIDAVLGWAMNDPMQMNALRAMRR